MRLRLAPSLLAATFLAVTCLGSSVPAGAAPAETDPTCTPAVAPSGDGRTARPADGPTYTDADLRQLDRRLDRRLAGLGHEPGAARVGATLRIGVHVHVIGGKSSEGATKSRVRRQLEVLDSAYAGGQSATNAETRFDFHLASFERVHNGFWREAVIGSNDDVAMRRSLHRGGSEALNLYVSKPQSPATGIVLGWATPPSEARRNTFLDGVVLHQGSLPGGSFAGYNRGDTAVHEVGHWLGLFHTFEGGCEGPGDLVDDTPPQAESSTLCDPAKDTCVAQPGVDSVQNFMDYSVDDCMNMFTPQQVSRMHDNWLAYRTP